MSTFAFIQVNHHLGNLEWCLAFVETLGLSPKNIFVDFDNARLQKSLDSNVEIRSLLAEACQSEGAIGGMNPALRLFRRIFPSISVLSLRKRAKHGKTHISRSLARTLLRALHTNLGKQRHHIPSDATVLLIGKPLVRVEKLEGREIRRFETPIAPTNLPSKFFKNRLDVGLIYPGSSSDYSFPSPTLANHWTEKLLAHSLYVPSSRAVGQTIFLAMRAPDTDNLDSFETTAVLEQIRCFVDENPGTLVIYRDHPRQSRDKFAQDPVKKILGQTALKYPNHPRILAGASDVVISLGGTVFLEAVKAGTRIIAVSTSSAVKPEGWRATSFERFGFRAYRPDQVASALRDTELDIGREIVANERLLHAHLPAVNDVNTTARLMRIAVENAPRD